MAGRLYSAGAVGSGPRSLASTSSQRAVLLVISPSPPSVPAISASVPAAFCITSSTCSGVR
ncbi:hypothetical protein ATO1_06990 [Phaeobacter sp. 22II1-1F12B]|nr:hypothetical protein ATO1_06990 [Phaeobacter sp. 22II1-1F12B]